MTNKEKLKAIEEWQSSGLVHPLTCMNSDHRNLVGFEENSNVKLKCLDCDYVQHWVPDVVFKIDTNGLALLAQLVEQLLRKQ